MIPHKSHKSIFFLFTIPQYLSIRKDPKNKLDTAIPIHIINVSPYPLVVISSQLVPKKTNMNKPLKTKNIPMAIMTFASSTLSCQLGG